jgi:hypothetical protein
MGCAIRAVIGYEGCNPYCSGVRYGYRQGADSPKEVAMTKPTPSIHGQQDRERRDAESRKHVPACICGACVWYGEPGIAGRDDRRERLAQKQGW